MNDRAPDRRTPHRTRAQERIDALRPPTAAELLATVDDLQARLTASEQEAGDNRTGWQRAAADFANFRRRTELEREATLGLANELLLLKVLALADDFDRALAAMPPELAGTPWIEGIAAIDRKLRLLLDSEGITPIEAVGKAFDPHEHEAVVQQETASAADDTVLNELQRGYRIRDRVLRPALVSVARNPGRPATAEQED